MTDQSQIAIAAEKRLLAVLLMDEDVPEILGRLKTSDFLVEDHRKIFTAISKVHAKHNLVNTILVIDELAKERSGIDMVKLSSLTDGMMRSVDTRPILDVVIQKSQLRRLASLSESAALDAQGGSVPPEQVIRRLQDSLNAITDHSRNGAKPISEVMKRTLAEMEIQARQDGLLGLSTGIECIDSDTGGLRRGEMWVVGALPGRGKTAFALQLAGRCSADGVPTLIFSLEMTATQAGRRLLSNTSGVLPERIRNPKYMTPQDWDWIRKTAGVIEKWPAWIEDASEIRLSELYSKCAYHVRKHQVQLIVVDYLMLVSDPEEKEIRIRAGKIANTMRRVAKDLNVSVVLLSQLSRPRGKNMNDRPTMIDLRESGDIEAAAHVVLLLYMPVDEQQKPTGEDEIIIGKNREGRLGAEPVLFHPQQLRFVDRIT